MSIRYILVGGSDYAAPDGGKKLCAAMAAGADRPVKVLSCCFAEKREDWEEEFSKAKKFLTANLGPDTVCELAFPATFYEQAATADIIYIHGGDLVLMAHYLDQYPDLAQKVFAGKTVVGSSAGAMYIARRTWSCDWRGIQEGRGLLPLCVIPHFDSDFGASIVGPIDWQKAKAELEAVAQGLPINCLREGEFIEVTVE